MNTQLLYERTQNDLSRTFLKHGIALDMQPVDNESEQTPAVWIHPYQVDGRPRQYNSSSAQTRDFKTRFIIVCPMDRLRDCQDALQDIYENYEYIQEDCVFDEMKYEGGEIVQIHGSLIVWAEVYSNYKLGGC